MESPQTPTAPPIRGFLGLIERVGNMLPDPIFLFIGATVLIFGLSALGSALGWSVQPVRPRAVMETVTGSDGLQKQRPKLDTSGLPVVELVNTGTPIGPRSLATSDGLYWFIANMVRNFTTFAPMGVVLVSMFGIGVAEKTGLFAAAIRFLAMLVPRWALTPMVVFLGLMSHVASDAGYIVLPPLAAALFAAYGRSPIAGIAAAFAGIASGFSANLIIVATDALVAPLTERGAQIIEPGYPVPPTCNWYFMASSTGVLLAAGWLITAWIVEPRQAARPCVIPPMTEGTLTRRETRGLAAALAGALIALGVMITLVAVPGAPLYGSLPTPARPNEPIATAPPAAEGRFVPDGPSNYTRGIPVPGTLTLNQGVTVEAAADEKIRGAFRTNAPVDVRGNFDPPADPQARWIQAIVPFILLGFLLPGLAYGIVAGTIRGTSDVTKAFVHAMTSMAPIIALSFFAAQFIECFRFSHLDAMVANIGGKALVESGLPRPLMLIGVILLVIVVDVIVSSMSAKWAALAPILVPMLMMAGISPELTQAAYRIGDSVANPVSPLNAYLIIVLAVMQRYQKDAGIGSLISMMMPYALGFFVVWTAFLLGWVALGLPLGPGTPLWYAPGH